LRPLAKTLTDTVKMIACCAETALVGLLRKYFANEAQARAWGSLGSGLSTPDWPWKFPERSPTMDCMNRQHEDFTPHDFQTQVPHRRC
jgi:hypothetical protein